MMMRRKVFCLALCLALLLAALPAALAEADAPAQTRRLRLGSSVYTIEVDASFGYGAVTEQDIADGQVAYMYSDSLAVDFDVYQRGPGGDTLPLSKYVAQRAADLGNADEIVIDGEINGTPAGWYHTVEAYEGTDYQTVTYVLDDGEDFVEITFWLDGEDAEAVVQGMINSLDYVNLAPFRLGSSPYWVFASTSFREGGMTSADVADGQVAYWVSDETLLDFDIYQLAKEGLPERLEEYVAREAEAHSATDTGVQTVNEITVGWYRTVEAWEGRDYDTLTCVLDAGDEYVEVVFWLDGLTAAAEADAIIKSLWMEDDAWATAVDEPLEPVEDGEPYAEGEVADAAGEWAGEVADAAGEWADETADAAGEWAGEVADAAGEWAGEAADAVGEWAGEAADAVGEWADEAADAAGEWADEAADAAGEWAGETADVTDEWVGDALEAADEAMDVAPEAAAPATRLLRLGTSPFTLVVPAGFVEGEMTQEDVEDDQVAYYYSNDTLLDFDVYQFSKDGYANDLATYAQEETSGYNSVTDLETGVVNGVYAAWYRTVEEYNDVAFDTLTYILDGGDEYVEICFWLDGDTADAEADAIIRTLASDNLAEPVGGEGAVVVEPIEETTAPQRTSLDEFEAAVGEAGEDRDGEAAAPADGPDAIEEPAEAVEEAAEAGEETAGDEAPEAAEEDAGAVDEAPEETAEGAAE